MMMNLNKFTINNISKKLNKINSHITLSHTVPFPHITLLSHYQFKKRYVHILQNGDIQGIPCEATYSNFRIRIGETLYNELFHVLVEIFHQLKMITFTLLSHDGTLYPSFARYHGCAYFCDQCASIKVNNVLSKGRNAILHRLDTLSKNNLRSECRIYTECPSTQFPEEIKKPRVELFAFRLDFCDGHLTKNEKNTAHLFRVKQELASHHLCIHTIRSNLTSIDPIDGSITIRCPKFPKDIYGKIGVRKNPQNPDKTEKVFGYNAVFSTSVELALGIELPVASSNCAGNAEEADLLVKNRKQISDHHDAHVMIDIADSKYDVLKNYTYVRNHGSIPIIEYNVRNEHLTKDDLTTRGYDQKGQPFAPCGLLCRPNGFDEQRERLTFYGTPFLKISDPLLNVLIVLLKTIFTY
ncbi:MAG: hypothetical protein ACMUJM_06340 [bacterium]